MTKLLLQNLDQFSATKSGQISTSKFWTTGILQNLAWSNFSFNIVTKIQVQLLYQILASKPCQLLSTLSSISTSRIFELASSKVRVTSVGSTKQQWVSQWKWQGYTMIGLGSDINEIVGNDTGIIAHWWTWDLEDPVKNADNVVKDSCSSNLHGHQSLFFKYLFIWSVPSLYVYCYPK